MFPQKLQLMLRNFLRWLKLMLKQSYRPVAAEVDIGWEIGMGSLEGSKGLAGIEGGQVDNHSWEGSLDGRAVEGWD